ncbi:NADPH-dependent glutamate synthase beta chain and related oxidoreductases [Candidatus Scalindua japonica]|uniref:NADPH-dependent glutamate synthase beta chain and related oxidoreductases n=1 Tax=Candidatus Scalindua japonica TaxID=1284222 RepID=A0A286TUG4_9BACT|nr:glutamate synthase subunit beta [Candidatus Scalindua japonica]GAX59518.1 NADPH-dependent glutamate synthase beta chain and related oxidoreductases [Candidatus Scalindua japonica]
MGKPSGFLEMDRKPGVKLPVDERIKNFQEFEQNVSDSELESQASRCMDCGIPSCHAYGCAVKNRIPDWNDLVYKGHWKRALAMLHSTNNFPEFTGRVCPATCEASCTLSINRRAVTIRQIEKQIAERGWSEGWIQPQPAEAKTGKRVAIVGSGPAGLAAAQQLVRKGHDVTVFEKDDRIGGMLRYGIPDYKIDRSVLERRLNQLKEEGVSFETQVNAGIDISGMYLSRTFDAVVICVGAQIPRNLVIPGRDLDGVHFAMPFLTQQNRRIAGDIITDKEVITAEGKSVIVIGGGDTGSDCIGTSIRQGAASVTHIYYQDVPPKDRPPCNPWPEWPKTFSTSSSQEEGCERFWKYQTKEFIGKNGKLTGLKVAELDWTRPEDGSRGTYTEKPGSEKIFPADLVFISIGFQHCEHGPLINDLKLELDKKGGIKIDDNKMSCLPGIFAAGDAELGASLVVRAIYSGRQAASGVHQYLMSERQSSAVE